MTINVEIKETYTRTSYTATEITETLQAARVAYDRFVTAAQALKLAIEPYYKQYGKIRRLPTQPTPELQALMVLHTHVQNADTIITRSPQQADEQYPVAKWQAIIKKWNTVSTRIEKHLKGGA